MEVTCVRISLLTASSGLVQQVEQNTVTTTNVTRKRSVSDKATSKALRIAQAPVPKPLRPISNDRYGLIQEELQDNLFALLVQTILWNQTTGRAARPVLTTILARYPSPEKLALAKLDELTLIIHPIGMHNRRAKRLIDLAQTWLAAPPCRERRYRKVGYPYKHSGKDVKPGEVLDLNDPREGWEVAHLPGIGAYALDSYRMFQRDKLRNVDDSQEPEWMKVVPLDKELRPWMVWRWAREGQAYDVLTGNTSPLPSTTPLDGQQCAVCSV